MIFCSFYQSDAFRAKQKTKHTHTHTHTHTHQGITPQIPPPSFLEIWDGEILLKISYC